MEGEKTIPPSNDDINRKEEISEETKNGNELTSDNPALEEKGVAQNEKNPSSNNPQLVSDALIFNCAILRSFRIRQ